MRDLQNFDINTVVVSSRVRIARNLESAMTFDTTEKRAFNTVADTIVRNNKDFVAEKVSVIAPGMVRALFEQHLISKELLENKANSWIVVRKDNKVCVMLGEEDHIRIQSIHRGMELRRAFTESMKIADSIASEHKLAFRDDFGYLTSCPTNIGCGMRASVMIFLPALSITNQISDIVERLRDERITVRGVYGEGSEAGGYMYQISNQACLGMSEQSIIENVESIALQIAKIEIELQQKMFKDDPEWIVDQVYRSWGILTNALMISTSEAVDHLAMLKLGNCLGIIGLKNNRVLDDLFFTIQPATIITQDDRASSMRERDKVRAAKISQDLRALRIK
jgi:protein arginine kinase